MSSSCGSPSWPGPSMNGALSLPRGCPQLLTGRSSVLRGISFFWASLLGGFSYVTPGNLRPPCQARMVTHHRHRV